MSTDLPKRHPICHTGETACRLLFLGGLGVTETSGISECNSTLKLFNQIKEMCQSYVTIVLKLPSSLKIMWKQWMVNLKVYSCHWKQWFHKINFELKVNSLVFKCMSQFSSAEFTQLPSHDLSTLHNAAAFMILSRYGFINSPMWSINEFPWFTVNLVTAGVQGSNLTCNRTRGQTAGKTHSAGEYYQMVNFFLKTNGFTRCYSVCTVNNVIFIRFLSIY